MADSTKDKVEGAFHDAKGAVKEKIGQATNNPDLEDEGTAEKIGGKVQKKVGDAEKALVRTSRSTCLRSATCRHVRLRPRSRRPAVRGKGAWRAERQGAFLRVDPLDR